MKLSFSQSRKIGYLERRVETPHIQASMTSNRGPILKLCNIYSKTIWAIALGEFGGHLILPLSNMIIKISTLRKASPQVHALLQLCDSPTFFSSGLLGWAQISCSLGIFSFLFIPFFPIARSAEGNSPSLVLFRRSFTQFGLLFLGICDADKALSLWKLNAH